MFIKIGQRSQPQRSSCTFHVHRFLFFGKVTSANVLGHGLVEVLWLFCTTHWMLLAADCNALPFLSTPLLGIKVPANNKRKVRMSLTHHLRDPCGFKIGSWSCICRTCLHVSSTSTCRDCDHFSVFFALFLHVHLPSVYQDCSLSFYFGRNFIPLFLTLVRGGWAHACIVLQ